MEQCEDPGSIPPADIQPPSGSGVARVTPIRPALQPPAAIMMFMALYPGVSALLNQPVRAAWSWPWRTSCISRTAQVMGPFDLAVIGTIP